MRMVCGSDGSNGSNSSNSSNSYGDGGSSGKCLSFLPCTNKAELQNGCPWDEPTCRYAAAYVHGVRIRYHCP